MNALTPQKAAKPAAVQEAPASETVQLIHVIERMARDTTLPLDRLEKVIELQERLSERHAEAAFNVAMALAQAKMQPVRAEADNPQTRSKYASYAALDRAVRPIYTEQGFALSFNTGDGAPPDHVRVLCDVSNGSYTKQYRLDIPADGKGARGGDVMTKTHATMSAVTYGKRGLLGMIFNIAVSHRGDDDGNAAGNTQFITEDQVAALCRRADKLGDNVLRKLCEFLRVDGLARLPVRRHGDAVTALDNYERGLRERGR